MRRALVVTLTSFALHAAHAQRASLFQSASSADTAVSQHRAFRVAMPVYRFTYNSHLPYSLNDGAQWAGRGGSMDLIAGVYATWGPLHVTFLPEFTWSANADFPRPASPPNPIPPPPRSPFSSPWHDNGQSIDLPWRQGDQPIKQLWPGQSTLAFDFRNATVGVSTENEWWGPGVRNALILSNNAPGFEHAFIRTRRPLSTPIGIFDARLIAGTLRESRYFDTDKTNDLRSISLLGITWTPHGDSGLTVGMARSVFAPATSRGRALLDAYQVFADVGHPNAKPYNDSTRTPGRDQLISFFLRWAFPKDGFATWAEWARTEIPLSVRDFLIYPNHTQGYTLGLSWLGDTLKWNARLRAFAEFTFLEQSTTYRHRDIGSWYTSAAVVQGYTNRGQSLGAAIGPGSSSQFLGLDYVLPTWEIGVYFNRIRWLEDAHSQQPYSPPATGWCEHDVALLPGIRGSARTKFGDVSVDYSSGWRLNVFFENKGPCPSYLPQNEPRDIRNKSLTLQFAPKLF